MYSVRGKAGGSILMSIWLLGRDSRTFLISRRCGYPPAHFTAGVGSVSVIE